MLDVESVETWDVEKVCAWVSARGFPADGFRSNAVSGAVLVELEHTTLKEVFVG